jgi:arsenite methyltransferase
MKRFFLVIYAILTLFLTSACTTASDSQRRFNELASESRWQPDRVLDTLAIAKGSAIGDLGAGGGYYTYRLAEITGPEGRVIAADINPEFIANIKKEARTRGLNHVEAVVSTADDSKFDDASLDLIFFRNTFHHIDNKGDYLRRLATKLRPGGRIALIDYREDASILLLWHNVSRDEILESVNQSGLTVAREYDFLEGQYFFILQK